MREFPHIPPGSQFSDIGASQWRNLSEQVQSLSRAVFGDNNTQRSPSGVRSTARTLPPVLRWPDKTVVITKKPVAGDSTLTVREARYTNLPPKPCTGDGDSATCFYTWHGPTFEVYPPLGVKPIAYDGDENTMAVTTPPKLATKFHRIHREHNVWVLEQQAAGGSNVDLCLVHSSILTNGNWVGNLYIRVVHVQPHATLVGQYVSAESTEPRPNPAYVPGGGQPETLPALGYSTVKCWPGTDDRDWQHYKSTTGTAPTFAPLPNAVHLKTLMWKGAEYITPEVAIFSDTPNPALPAGDC